MSGAARLVLVVCLMSVGLASGHPGQAVATPAPAGATITSPDTRVLANVRLHDTTIMQSFVHNPADGTWLVAQVMQGGRFGRTRLQHARAGDLTLTKLSPTGKELGHMFLRGFGHGISMGLENSRSTTYVWLEARAEYVPPLSSANGNGYGTQIGRFRWRSGARLTSGSSAVTRYGVNGGKPEQSPYVDVKANRIAVHYYSPTQKNFRWAVYELDQFKKHRYTALERVTWPKELLTITNQGWAYVDDSTFINLNGNGYGPDNPPPGNTTLFTVHAGGKTPTRRLRPTSGPTLRPREPEGATLVGGVLCIGLTSKTTDGSNRANVYCQQPVPGRR